MPAQYENWSPDEYHSAKDFVSHSQMEDFHKSPALYFGRHVSRTIEPMQSDALDFGTLVHSAILRPDFSKTIIEIPARVLSANGSRAGGAWKDFAAEHEGKTLLKTPEFKIVRAMADSILAHPKALKLLEAKGKNEQAFTWTDEETGIACRALVDKVCEKMGMLVDLKTARSADPRQFANAAYQLGYHRQDSHYSRGYAALTGELPGFVFIAIEKTPPYRVETIQLDANFKQLGDESNADILVRMKSARASGNWQTPTWGTIVEVPPPAYSKYDAEWAFDRDE